MAITFRPGQYSNLGAFLTKITVKAIAKIEEGSTNDIMRIAENVTAWATSNIISSEQVDEIAAALPKEDDSDIPSENEGEISPGGDETIESGSEPEEV